VKQSLVSVIIPAFNAERYLERAIDSVLSQTYSSIELIVVDDGSVDSTADICRSYGDRIRYFYQENQGVSVARNRGIEEANGEYIAFLDADDWYLPNKLEDQVAALELHPAAGGATAAHIVKLADDERRNPPEGLVLGPGVEHGLIDLYEHRSQGRFVIHTSTVLVRKSVLDAVGGFRPDLRFGEDVELWARIHGKYDWVYVDKAVAVYDRTSETSVTALIPEHEHGIGFLYTNAEIQKYLRPKVRRYYRKYRQQLCLQRAAQGIKQLDKNFVRECMRRATPPPLNFRFIAIGVLALLPVAVWKIFLQVTRRG
jgi:glycosyltransferase involved in cell wall biosynthesis